jgi:acetyl-CoA hydrolase
VHADHLRLTGYCGAGHNRALADAGVLDIHPHPYSRLGALIRSRAIPADVVLVQVSPPNANGEYSLGLAAEYLVPALETCRTVIAEVNDRIPWTYTERLLKDSDIALAVRTSRAPAPVPYGAPGATELAIARNCAAFIPDAATLEFGLGALPDAVLSCLADRTGLRVHSGALGDGVAELMQRGTITDGRWRPARHAEAVRLRTRQRAAPAPFLGLYPRPGVLAGIDRFVAINSAVEVDLTGQVNAEVAGGHYVGAVGGALDFIRAANHSPGGVSIIALPATVGGKASRIVAHLSGAVATPRSEAGVIVTERGAADLRGQTLRERARRMIALAAPALRERLSREAAAMGL